MSAVKLSRLVTNHLFLAVKQADHLLSEEFVAYCNKEIQPDGLYQIEDVETELFELGRIFAVKHFEEPYTNMLQWLVLHELVSKYQDGQNGHLLAFFNKYDKHFFQPNCKG